MKRRGISACTAMLAALLLGNTPLPSPPSGKALYVQHCASCHGLAGHGDGPDADIVAEKPRDLGREFIDAYSADQLVRRILDGQRLPIALDPAAMRRQAGDVETIVGHLERLPFLEWKKILAGWDLYADRCQECHGPYGSPGAKLPPGVRQPRDLADRVFQSATTEDDLILAVRHGKAHMPALTPQVGRDDAHQLAAYVRLLSPGIALYTRYCASCHGDDGLGADSATGTLGMPSVRFDRDYFARRDPEVLRKNVWHMLAEAKPAMPHYRWEIDEARARAIVEFLKGRR